MFCVVLVFYGIAGHCIQYMATKGEIDLKKSLEFLLVRLNVGQCDRKHYGRTQGSKIDRTPRRPASRAVALANPSLHRFQPCVVVVMSV
jgi:hypothetical protein